MPIRLGTTLFDRDAHTLTRNGAALPVTPKAFTLLEALVDAHPAAVSKEALYARLWPDVIVEPGNLHNLISELRNALGADAIRTVQRFGYALAQQAPVRYRLSGAVDLALPDGETIIGRDVTGSPDVSRRHARVLVGDSSVTVEDLGSKNGTFVRGSRAEGVTTLAEGDEVLFGRARFVLCATTDSTLTVNETRG